MCLAYNAAMQMSSNMIKIKRGLDIPLAGAPAPVLDTSLSTRAVALLGPDYQGMKPTMAVQLGDSVKQGQLLFMDKKCEGVRYTAPAGGRIAAINRGAKRAFQSIVIEVDEDQAEGFDKFSFQDASGAWPDAIKRLGASTRVNGQL